jgi:hypothetical protein
MSLCIRGTDLEGDDAFVDGGIGVAELICWGIGAVDGSGLVIAAAVCDDGAMDFRSS